MSSNPARCTRYNVIKFFSDLRRSVVFPAFLNQYNEPPQYNWNLVEKALNTMTLLSFYWMEFRFSLKYTFDVRWKHVSTFSFLYTWLYFNYIQIHNFNNIFNILCPICPSTSKTHSFSSSYKTKVLLPHA